MTVSRAKVKQMQNLYKGHMAMHRRDLTMHRRDWRKQVHHQS